MTTIRRRTCGVLDNGIHTFIEDHDEKLEEDRLFPRLEHANRLTAQMTELAQFTTRWWQTEIVKWMSGD